MQLIIYFVPQLQQNKVCKHLVQVINHDNIISLHRINYIIPKGHKVFVRRILDWQGRTKMAEYLYGECRQLKAYVFYRDILWGNYGIGIRGVTSIPESGKETIYKAAYLKSVTPGLFTYDVVRGLFGVYSSDISRELDYQPYFRFRAVAESAREVKDGEGRLTHILSGYSQLNKTTGRPEGTSLYINFLIHKPTPYSLVDAGPFHLGISEGSYTYEYKPEYGLESLRYAQPTWWAKNISSLWRGIDNQEDSSWKAHDKKEQLKCLLQYFPAPLLNFFQIYN